MSHLANESGLEIRDPGIDADQVLQRVAEAVAHRRASGAYEGPSDLLEPVPLRPGGLKPSSKSSHQALAELTARTNLQEIRFGSSVPVVGSLIVAVRNIWSWMAARWIGQHLSAQQTAFNQAAVRLVGNLVHRQDAGDQQLQYLQARVDALEARLVQLERQEKERTG